MNWILLSLIGALSQAAGSAFKKKALQTPGMNNVIGFVSFVFAGIIFWALFMANSGTLWADGLTLKFWHAMFWYAGLNVLAVYYMYKALDIAEFNYLMPFMTLTSLLLIIPPIFLLGEIPSVKSIGGIALIVGGAIIMSWHKRGNGKEEVQRKSNRKGVLYFLITALCFTIAPTAAKITIQESSVLFSSLVVHLAIGFGFLLLLFIFREMPKLPEAISKNNRKLLFAILIAGTIIVIENGSINLALKNTEVAYVFAIKRLMPLFAFLIGIIYFKERAEIAKKILATALMVAGAVIVTLYK